VGTVPSYRLGQTLVPLQNVSCSEVHELTWRGFRVPTLYLALQAVPHRNSTRAWKLPVVNSAICNQIHLGLKKKLWVQATEREASWQLIAT